MVEDEKLCYVVAFVSIKRVIQIVGRFSMKMYRIYWNIFNSKTYCQYNFMLEYKKN